MFSLCCDTTAGHYIIKAYPQLLALLLFSSSPLAIPLPRPLQSNSSLISYIADIPPQLITSKLQFVLVKPRLPGSLLGTVINKLLLYFIIGRCNITQEFVFSVCVSVSSFKVWYIKWRYQLFCDSSHKCIHFNTFIYFLHIIGCYLLSDPPLLLFMHPVPTWHGSSSPICLILGFMIEVHFEVRWGNIYIQMQKLSPNGTR